MPMHHGAFVIAVVLAAAWLAAPAFAQTREQRWQCTGKPDIPWLVQINGCTVAIGSGQYAGKDLAWVYGNRGVAYQFNGQLDRAIADYDQVIKLDPNNPTAFSNRGAAYRDKGQHDRAIEDFTLAIKLNPNDARAFFNRALTHRDKGQTDRAVADFNEAVRLDPRLDPRLRR